MLTLGVWALFFAGLIGSLPAGAERTTEFCLRGEIDLGVRYQGLRPGPGEFHDNTWCVVTDDTSRRVEFSATGNANADMDNSWRVAYLPPDKVRVVNSDAPPDIEFQGTDNLAEALRVRRLDPRRLLQDFKRDPNALNGVEVTVKKDNVTRATFRAEMPLRGEVTLTWHWDWTEPQRPRARLMLENELVFRATGEWRDLSKDEAEAVWQPTPGADPTPVPGDRWPARIRMSLIELGDGLFLVRGVRTGFQHLVVTTDKGLVVADAPAGWLELHQIPASDLVPGLGPGGLSGRFISFLREQFGDIPIRAVALTHFHDDHAGGAAPFIAAGATVYAPSADSAYLTSAVERADPKPERHAGREARAQVVGVAERIRIGEKPHRITLLPMGRNPHTDAMLGVWAEDQGYFFVSDVHVPRTDAPQPSQKRAKTECWFAAWAVARLPSDVRVINSHSQVVTPVARLARYLESDVCKALVLAPSP